ETPSAAVWEVRPAWHPSGSCPHSSPPAETGLYNLAYRQAVRRPRCTRGKYRRRAACSRSRTAQCGRAGLPEKCPPAPRKRPADLLLTSRTLHRGLWCRRPCKRQGIGASHQAKAKSIKRVLRATILEKTATIPK